MNTTRTKDGGHIAITSNDGNRRYRTLKELMTAFSRAAVSMPDTSAIPKDTLENLVRGVRVLIVDDEPEIAEELQQILAYHEIESITAGSATEALQKIYETGDIAVITADINMPELDGLEMLRRIKEEFGGQREIVSLILTANVGSEEAIEALRIGAIEFLSKPVSSKKFVAAVKQAQEIALSRLASRQLMSQLELQVDNVRKALSQYAGAGVVEELDELRAFQSDAGQMCEVTYLFTDVEGFTSLSETLNPHDLAVLLGDYLEGLCEFVAAHGGAVDKFMGDAVVARFGPRERDPEFTSAAVQCALDIDDFARQFSDIQKENGIRFGGTRIGVHTGPAYIGRIGGPRRADFTGIGDTVNTASRLEGANKYFRTSICISESAAVGCRDVPLRPMGQVVLKGKATGLGIYQPFRPQTLPERLLADYSDAYHLLDHDSQRARARFAALRKEWPDDPLVAFYFKRLESGLAGSSIVLSGK